MDLAACSGTEAVNHSAWQHLHFPREPGESRGSIPCPRLQGKPRASSLEKPAQPHGSAHQAGERELCRNCAGRMQEGCRKDAGNTPHSLPDHLFSFHHFFFSGRWEQSLCGGPGKSPAQLLLIPAAVALQSRVRLLHQAPLQLRFLPGFSQGAP